MDIDPRLLIFLFLFFVLPLIQRVLGGAKRAPPGSQPGQRRPGVPPGQAEGRVEGRVGAPSDRPDAREPGRAQVERATDLIPVDLWEVLTGERRSPAPPQRRPTPALEAGTGRQPDTETQWERGQTAAHIPDFPDEEPYQEEGSLERPWQQERERSTETAPPPAPQPVLARDTLSATAPARSSQRGEIGRGMVAQSSPYLPAAAAAAGSANTLPRPLRPRQRPLTPTLSSRSELKRAFVLREVLGPPKALE